MPLFAHYSALICERIDRVKAQLKCRRDNRHKSGRLYCSDSDISNLTIFCTYADIFFISVHSNGFTEIQIVQSSKLKFRMTSRVGESSTLWKGYNQDIGKSALKKFKSQLLRTLEKIEPRFFRLAIYKWTECESGL